MMIAANRFTGNYAEIILATSRPEALIEAVRPKKAEMISAEDIARMEAEMERLHQDRQAVEDNMLSLVVAKGFSTQSPSLKNGKPGM